MIDMLSFLAERIQGVQTKDEAFLASFLSQAVVCGDCVKIYLFGESRIFSFRNEHGFWKLALEEEKKISLLKGSKDIE